MRSDRSENFREMKDALQNGEYESLEEFMDELKQMLRHDNITTRHFLILKDKAENYFN